MSPQHLAPNPTDQDNASALLDRMTDYWQTTGELPPELVTGHRLIDFEHRFLISTIASLRCICLDFKGFVSCAGCDAGRRKHCETELVALLGDVFAFILEHFKTEEGFMRDSLLLMMDADVCRAHMEDHANISAKVQEIVSALDSHQTLARMRELDALLARWMTHHIQLHDMLLSRWIARDEAILKGL